MNRKSTLFFLLGLLLFSLNLVSCRKFEGTQTVPAYIHIESIKVDSLTDYYTLAPIRQKSPMLGCMSTTSC